MTNIDNHNNFYTINKSIKMIFLIIVLSFFHLNKNKQTDKQTKKQKTNENINRI